MDLQEPDVEEGIKYWENTPATLDGVLGGFGSGTLPRVDSLGSRQFLQSLIPSLCTVPSVLVPLSAASSDAPGRRTRALEIGAGIGRVTSSVLLHLIDDIVTIEPVHKFVEKAIEDSIRWKGIKDKKKSVTFMRGALQGFDPTKRLDDQEIDFHCHRVGYEGEDEEGFDVVWCQWALGHLSNADLVRFLKQSKKTLRASQSGKQRENGVIVVKENVCSDEKGGPAIVFDPEDSSLTRSNKAWYEIFKAAGLTVIREEVQHGLPSGLYEVKMYALR
ncbi:hypothetical protein FRC02_006949 [Tulasnella sp. 418]|nr:hypothetical protein FRC02_006949 [Tulasnella sp. 418]